MNGAILRTALMGTLLTIAAAIISPMSAEASTADTPSSGRPPPSSGAPSSGAPSSGAPSSGAPSSGAPSSGAPSSGAPSSGAPAASSGDPDVIDPGSFGVPGVPAAHGDTPTPSATPSSGDPSQPSDAGDREPSTDRPDGSPTSGAPTEPSTDLPAPETVEPATVPEIVPETPVPAPVVPATPATEQPDKSGPAIPGAADPLQPVNVPAVSTPVSVTVPGTTPVCDPNYATSAGANCAVPASEFALDCGDLAATDIPVVGTDVHGLDTDGDGIGCESLITTSSDQPVAVFAGAPVPLDSPDEQITFTGAAVGDRLPFTGAGSNRLAKLAIGLMLSGLAMIVQSASLKTRL